MIRVTTLVVGWVFVPLAIFAVAWEVAKNYVEEKVDE